MATADFSPGRAADFIRLCLVAAWQPEALGQAQALCQTPGFAWDAVAGLAAYEEAAPLLYVALRGQPWAPAPFVEALRLAYIQTGTRNTFYLAELEKALNALAAAGIPTLVLKGAALVERVYADAGLRPMVDLDLLLHAGDAPAACALLAAQGFHPPEVEPAAGLTLAFENELMLLKRGPIAVALELHWSLFDSPFYQHRLPLAWFWQSALPARIGATPARILGPEAELLHLCGHLALHHAGQGLLWQHDIAAVIVHTQDRLDWDLLLAQAVACQLVLPIQTLLPALA
jgi:hypothetical protein